MAQTRTNRRRKRRVNSKRFVLSLVVMTLFAGVAYGSWFNAPIKRVQTETVNRIKRELLTQPTNYDDPVNILLIGSDSRHGESARSDTLIFMNVNFEKRRVYLVSIPRDTRAYIPGRGTDKINAAYAYGQAHLAIRTVENFLGADLNHYVEVDFQGFKKLVDTLGGIEITVDKPINDRSREYRMYIPQGRQLMNGATGLNYVRYRHGDSDFERAKRQQIFLRALSDKVVDVKSVMKLPKLIGIFNDNVTTDMSKREMLSLGNFLRKVPKERLETVTVAGRSKMINGVSYVEPERWFISRLFERIEEGRSIKSMKSMQESDKISSTENSAGITVLNGSGKPGLAKQAEALLARQGYANVETGNAPRFDYRQTQIRFAEDNRSLAYALRRIVMGDALMIPVSRTTSGAVEVILGSDYYYYRQMNYQR